MSNSKRLRSPRYRPTDFRLGSLQAFFDHREQLFSAEVVDFSGQGLAVSVSGGGVFLAGDALPRLRVCRGSETFFDGPAVVRHVREEIGRSVLGIGFKNAWLDLRKVYDVDLRLDVEQRFAAFLHRLDVVVELDGRFKAWVAEIRYFLDELRAHLEAEEKRTRDVDQLTRETMRHETVDLVAAGVTRHLERALERFNEIVGSFDERQHQLHRAFFQHHLNGLFLESPFMARSFHKPLGYAGDYEVMNMLYRDHREGPSLFARVLNKFACSLTAAQANINRIGYLCGRLAEALRRRPDARVASVGCGPAQEIRQVLSRDVPVSRASFTLLDIEPRAIQYCEKVILSQIREQGLSVQVNFIQESIRELIRQERLDEVLEPQDVVIAAGLFDYFSDRMFQHLLTRLYGLLRPGGELLVGNVNTTNDSRFLMEYMAEWFLHHRSPADLERLASVLPPGAEVEVEWEPSGFNLFLHIRKRAANARVGPSVSSAAE